MNTYQVGERFWSGKAGKGSSVTSTGDKLFSYGTVILQRLSSGLVVGNTTKYSTTTSRHQSICRVHNANILVSDIPRGTVDIALMEERRW